jgi:hypothetical protein
MKRVMMIAPLLMFAAVGLAQDSSMNGTNSDQHEKPELRTIIGCLSMTNHTYVITGGGPGPKQFRIIGGDTSKLQGEIGQSVEVVGMVGKNNPEENMSRPYNEGTTTGVGYDTIMLEKVKILGGLCSFPGKEWRGDHESHR